MIIGRSVKIIDVQKKIMKNWINRFQLKYSSVDKECKTNENYLVTSEIYFF